MPNPNPQWTDLLRRICEMKSEAGGGTPCWAPEPGQVSTPTSGAYKPPPPCFDCLADTDGEGDE